jgi:hypothetical protein
MEVIGAIISFAVIGLVVILCLIGIVGGLAIAAISLLAVCGGLRNLLK